MSYKTVKYGKKAERRDYSKMLHQVELPNLIEIQTNSFEEFVKTGIDELLKDISPIEGHNGDLKLHFEESSLSEPKYDVIETKIRDLNYSRQLSAKVKLENAITGEVRESTVLMTDLPMMTPSGTFIINGAERVVVSQIVRSSGVYYSSELDKKINQIKYAAQVIPTRGAWIEYEQGSKEILYAKLDRSKKVPLTTFIRALGFTTKKDIEEAFGRSSLITNTFEKDETKSPNEAVIDLYSKLRQGEKVPADAAREFIRMRLFDARRYDLAKVGRYKFNKKLDVLARAEGTYLANDIILDGEVLVAKDTHLTKEVIQLLDQNRDAFRKQLITKENNLQKETADEILTTTLPEGGNTLYAKENVVNLKTGEILVKKNEAITEEVLTNLRKNRHSIDEKVIKYFLTEDVYKKESLRQDVISEILDVYIYDDAGNKSNVIRIIGSDQREDRIFVAVSDIVASISYFLNLYEGLGKVDDIDHLGNRRLRLIGELLKNQFRIGLARAEKNIKDKMSKIGRAHV